MLPLGFVVGASAQALLAGLCALVVNDFGVYSVCAHWGIVLLLLLETFVGTRGAPRPSGRRLLAAGAAAVVLAGVAAVGVGPIEFGEDAWDHIGYTRRVVTENALVPEGVLAPAPDAEGTPPDPRKGMFHSVVALVAHAAQADATRAWAFLPIVFYPLAVLALVAFCRPFVTSRMALAACAAMFLVSYGGPNLRLASESVYGQNLPLVWFWLLVPLCLDPTGSPRSRRGLMAWVVAGGVFVHAGVALHAGVLALTLCLFAGPLGLVRRSALGDAAVIAAALVPGLAVRLAASCEANFLHAHPQGLLYLGERWFVMSPLEIVRYYGLPFLGGLALLPATALLARGDRRARRQLAFAIVPVVMCFVPPVATYLFEAATYMAFRSLSNIPVYPVIATAVVLLVVRARQGGWARRAVVAVGLSVWAVLFVTPGVRAVAAGFGERERAADFEESCSDLVRYLNTLPQGVVIASDPRTSYGLSALTPHRYVAVYGQHASPCDRDAGERLRAVRDILSPFSRTRAVLDACDRYGVDFVVCNGRSPTRARDYLALWDRAFYRTSASKLRAIAGRFRPVFEKDDIVVMLHDPSGTGQGRWSAPTPPLRYGGAPGNRCGVSSPRGDYEIAAVSVEPARVVPGETVRVTLVYSKRRMLEFALPDVVHLRFDHESIPTDRRYPGEKHVRRFRERSEGSLRRFRHDHAPFGALFPREYWPIGIEFHEVVEVRVPSWARLGRYRLEVSVETVTLLPNVTLDDFLYNRDHYSGTACAEVEVTDRVVR